MKKDMPTTRALLFFSWIIMASSVAIAIRTCFVKGFVANSLFEGFFFVVGGTIVAVFLRMIAKIGQLVFDLKCDLIQAVQRMDQGVQRMDQGVQQIDQGVERIAQGVQQIDQSTRRIDQGVQQIDQSTQRIDQGVQRIDQSTQRIDESARKTEEFLMKMKRHIEAQ